MPTAIDVNREEGEGLGPFPQDMDLYAYEVFEHLIDMDRLFNIYQRKQRTKRANWRKHNKLHSRATNSWTMQKRSRIKRIPKYHSLIAYDVAKRRRMERISYIAHRGLDADDHIDFIWE